MIMVYSLTYMYKRNIIPMNIMINNLFYMNEN